ncbi:hypothetical protein [Nocardioides sp. cx-173]|uniref:hypothetical protein n=1 Tax=Nocardioides sp. cx-173 TaxID=2898796 RepID=UPI001E579CA9|nr:hypothetical protein [Nocardioides sp. cx-173]MCD4525271.1 hypothetical protein [Nocardioides sp. cx-173]UGB40927.1 hypothetical protein LQ940_16310 [Nocardioides sp. cx-173]
MLVETDAASGAVRLDDEGLAALLAGEQPGPEPLLAVIAEPTVTLGLAVAGVETRLEHRAWVTRESAALLLGVRPGLFQLMAHDPAFLTAALVRLTRMRPRRVEDREPVDLPAERLPDLVAADETVRRAALAAAGADFAWHLSLRWQGGQRDLVAVDGPRGLHLGDPAAPRLVPVSNTTAYRILSTALPTDV